MKLATIKVGIAVSAALVVLAIFFIGMSPFSVAGVPTTVSGTGGLVVQDVIVGSGAAAVPGAIVTVHYTGHLEDGTVFDSSEGAEPFTFTLGTGAVIAGWEQGLVGMQQGGRRLLVIPAALGYGAMGRGPIPPNATLVFEVQMIHVQPAAVAQ